jgi:hypothetical protein
MAILVPHKLSTLLFIAIASSLGFALLACGGDVRVSSNSRCNGVQEPSEDTVDQPFDEDGDGYFDGENTDCQEAYDVLDCDDGNAAVHPGLVEIECNALDDDCDEETVESVDWDEDGSSSCEDCDDSNGAIFPGNAEICDGLDNDCDPDTDEGVDADEDGSSSCVDCDDSDPVNFPGNTELCDGLDNNCNDQADEGLDCFTDYAGTWVITPPISYSCASNTVTVNVSALEVTDAGGTILFTSPGTAQPGVMSGPLTDGTDFTATNAISSGGAGCDETYNIAGSFDSLDSFTATFTASFYDASGTGLGCGDGVFFVPVCADQSWSIAGSR